MSSYEQTKPQIKEHVGSSKQYLLYYVLCHRSSSFFQPIVDHLQKAGEHLIVETTFETKALKNQMIKEIVIS